MPWRGPPGGLRARGGPPPPQRTPPPSVNEAAEQNAEQNALFGNKVTNADLLARLFGKETPDRMRFCWAPLLATLVGGGSARARTSRETRFSAVY